MKMTGAFVFLSFTFLVLGCSKKEDSEPPASSSTELQLWGYSWNKYSTGDKMEGPGPNYWTNNIEAVWKEGDNLHLKPIFHNGEWYCPMVNSKENFGYGIYIFYVTGDLNALDENTVFGLYTYDNSEQAFYTSAYTENDIEFSRWGHHGSQENLHYSVQPTQKAFGKLKNIPLYLSSYDERHDASHFEIEQDKSTHVIIWYPSGVYFSSYSGHGYPSNTLIKAWSFLANNQPRRRYEYEGELFPSGDPGKIVETSDIIIPIPTPATKVNINFWLYNGTHPDPTKIHEIVINKFKFIPYTVAGEIEGFWKGYWINSPRSDGYNYWLSIYQMDQNSFQAYAYLTETGDPDYFCNYSVNGTFDLYASTVSFTEFEILKENHRSGFTWCVPCIYSMVLSNNNTIMEGNYNCPYCTTGNARLERINQKAHIDWTE